MAMKCCTKLETAKKRCPIVFQGHPSNFKVTQNKTSPILTQIGRFRTIGRSQLSNPSDLPCLETYTSLKSTSDGSNQYFPNIKSWYPSRTHYTSIIWFPFNTVKKGHIKIENGRYANMIISQSPVQCIDSVITNQRLDFCHDILIFPSLLLQMFFQWFNYSIMNGFTEHIILCRHDTFHNSIYEFYYNKVIDTWYIFLWWSLVVIQ